jgi:hypothetical protein
VAKNTPIVLQFPHGGLVRKYGFQTQPPWTTCDCLNVRPFSAENGRRVGGTRPGLAKSYNEELGSGEPVRLLADVTSVGSGAAIAWTDDFSGTTLGDLWEAIGAATLPQIFTTADAVSTTAETVAAARTAIAGVDNTQAYQIGLYISPYLGAHHGKYRIFGMMAATTPNAATNGFIVELTMTGAAGGTTCTLKKYVAAAETAVDSGTATDTSAMEGWLTVLVNGTTVTAYWLGEEVASGTVAGLAGTRVGFGMTCTVAGGICLADAFRVQYYSTGTYHEVCTTLVASANGVLYRERPWVGAMVALTTDLTLASDVMLMGVSRGQKLYIADHGRRVKIASVTVDDTGVHLHQASTDWSDYAIDAHDDVVVVSDPTGAVVAGTYPIATVGTGDDGDLTLTGTGAIGDGTCTASVERAPKVYDPEADTLTILAATASLGQVPSGCPILVRYRDRLVLAGGLDAPNAWYMSRAGDPLDWDYAADSDDGARAVAGVTADSGEMGEPITALVAHADDLLVMGCTSSLWVMRGDPAYGGQIDRLSDVIGIVDRGAVCRTPESATVFLSLDGLYMLAPGAQTYPVSVSRELIPDELLYVDPALFTVTMAYDCRFRGIHIYLTPVGSRTQKHWWYDWQSKTFWPVQLQAGHQPTALYAHVSQVVGESRLLLGGSDGYIRYYSPTSETDDGSEIEAWVNIGPIRMSNDPAGQGMVSQLDGVLSETSGQVTWSLMPGATGEAAAKATALATGTWSAGLNYREHPRVSGAAMVLRVENAETDRRWNLEEASMIRQPAGDRTKE